MACVSDAGEISLLLGSNLCRKPTTASSVNVHSASNRCSIWYSIPMDGNLHHHKVKRYVVITIVVLSVVLFALIANLVRLQQVSTKSRAEELKTIIPTSAIPMYVTACGNMRINCNSLKPNLKNPVTAVIIPADQPGNVINMQCSLANDRKDALCGYKPLDTVREGCLRGAAFVVAGAGNTTPKCLAVVKNSPSNMCQIVELKKASGQLPVNDNECQQLIVTPTKTPPALMQ